MPKSSKIQIDEDEKKLLKTLQKNAGNSVEQIAKRCGFSRQKVWRIKKRLEKNNTIWGYNAVVDDEKLNLKRYLLLIKRTNKPVSAKDLNIGINRELKYNLEKLGINIDASFFIHGSFDWFFSITAKDISQIKRFTEGFVRMFDGYISDIQIQEVIFPVEKNNFTNPNLDQIKEFFV